MSNNYKYEQSGVGVWEYNEIDGKVTFTPEYGFIGSAVVYYSAIGLGTGGGPFDQDIYRSGATKMQIEIKKCNPSSVRVNPFLSR